MGNLDEFDINVLHALVDEAIRQESAQEPVYSFPSLSFSLGDTSLFELFYEALIDSFSLEKSQEIIEHVRQKYVDQNINVDLKTLYTFVKHCKKCDNVERNPYLTVGNLLNPDVVFVYDRPLFSTDAFRKWNDLLKEVGFQNEKIAHTCVTRCLPSQKAQPLSNDVILQCSKSYLFTELQLLSPKLIVACGLVPTKVFLGDIDTLNSHKGTIHWLGPWPIMPVHTMVYSEKSGPAALKNLQSDIQTAYNFCYG